MAKNIQTNIIIGGKINPTLKKVFDTAGKLAQKTSNIIAKTNQKISDSTKKINKSLEGVIKLSKKITLVGAAVGSAALLGSKAMLDQAASMEQYRNTLNVVMKDQKKAAQIFKWAVDFANKTPFDTDEVVEATVKLQSYGLEAQKVMIYVGDMAAAMGKSLDQAVEAIADAQTGELERLKEFGITKNQIVEHASQVLPGIEVVNNKGQITNLKAFNLALFDLMRQRFGGGMETQAKTYKGVMSTIVGVWKSGLAEMAGISQTGEIIQGSFFDVVKTKAEELGSVLTKMQEDGTFQELQKQIANFANTGINKLEELIPRIIRFGGYVIENGPKIIAIAKWIAGAFLTWKVISGVNTVLQTMLQLSHAISLIKTQYIPLLALKVKDIAETLYLQGLYAKDTVIMAGKTASIWAMTMAQKAWNIAVTAGTIAGKAFGAVMTFLTSPIGLVILAITALVGALYLLWKNWDTISKALVNVWQSYVVPFFQGIYSWFSGIFTSLSGTFKGFINYVIGGLNNLIQRLNSISFTLPDWIPKSLGGGKTFGINIPTIPTFAQGGIATRPSIFGEKGPEMAIPLKPKSPRSISLLQQTAKILGVQPAGESSITVIYSPNISGGNVTEIKSALEDDFEKFKIYIEQFFHDKRRENFA